MTLTLGGGSEELLDPLGPSSWGQLYRSRSRPSCYRLLPIEQAPLALRQQARAATAQPRFTGLAPLVECSSSPVYGREHYWIRYQIAPDKTFPEVLLEPDHRVRMAYAVRVLRMLPTWMARLRPDLHVMPADIVFSNGTPFLLAVPGWGPPPIEALFACPERARFVPPELLCGRGGPAGASGLLFSVVVGLLDCFQQPPPVSDAERLLPRLVKGLALERAVGSRLPYWVQQRQVAEGFLGRLMACVAPGGAGGATGPLALAQELEELLESMDPSKAARALRTKGQAEDAYNLLLDVFLEEDGYDLRVLAAQIARIDLFRPLEAVDQYESAIQLEPHRTEAYVRQFELIADSMKIMHLLTLLQGEGGAAERLDERIKRDFLRMSASEQEEHELPMARYLVWRRQFADAASFVYPRMFLNGQYAWWKFGIISVYAEVLLETGQLEHAAECLNASKGWLAHVAQNRKMSQAEIEEHGSRLAQLEVRLTQLRSEAQR